MRYFIVTAQIRTTEGEYVSTMAFGCEEFPNWKTITKRITAEAKEGNQDLEVMSSALILLLQKVNGDEFREFVAGKEPNQLKQSNK